MNALLDLTADLKDFLADVPNERGVGEGMKAWAKDLLDRLNAASTGNILDVAPQQEQSTKAVNHADGTGVVANRKPSINTNSDTNLIRKNSHSEGGEATAIASPLYLLASEIVDVVEFAAQYRAEEEGAAEEGALIEASGYNDPKFESNGRY